MLVIIIIFNVAWLIFRSVGAYRTRQRYSTTIGLVVDIARHKPDKSATVEHNYPVVEFHTEEGKTVVFKSAVGSPEQKYQPGQTIPVAYNKQNPYIAFIDSK